MGKILDMVVVDHTSTEGCSLPPKNGVYHIEFWGFQRYIAFQQANSPFGENWYDFFLPLFFLWGLWRNAQGHL